jgi:hypothetical protein
MAVESEVVQVSDEAALELAVTSYMSNGFEITLMQPTVVRLVKKKKELNPWYLVLGTMFCLFPGVLYAVYYAMQKDLVIEVRIGTTASVTPVVPRQGAKHYTSPHTGAPVPSATEGGTCTACGGSGRAGHALPWEQWRQCERCGGSGRA